MLLLFDEEATFANWRHRERQRHYAEELQLPAGYANAVSKNSSLAILLVADLFHPIDNSAVQPFLNCDVRHRLSRRRAMPVLFARRKPDDIARPDFLDGTAPALHASHAVLNRRHCATASYLAVIT